MTPESGEPDPVDERERAATTVNRIELRRLKYGPRWYGTAYCDADAVLTVSALGAAEALRALLGPDGVDSGAR